MSKVHARRRTASLCATQGCMHTVALHTSHQMRRPAPCFSLGMLLPRLRATSPVSATNRPRLTGAALPFKWHPRTVRQMLGPSAY